jgi:hypothetical protein
MLRISRTLLLSICIVVIAGCARPSDATITGTWRYDDDDVRELACRADHSFTSWESSKQELTTPGVLVDVGRWHRKGRDIIVDYEKGSWSKEGKREVFTIVRSSSDSLELKSSEGDRAATFNRLRVPVCAARDTPPSPSAIEQGIAGQWRLHYGTHDYEVAFRPDHSELVTASIGGKIEEINTGTWRVDGFSIVDQTKTALGRPAESEGPFKWNLVALATDCFAFREGAIPYALERIK